MAGFSDHAENRMIDWVLVTGAPTRPSGTWLALYTVTPGETTAGTEVTNANNYARQAVTFDASAAGATQNAATVSWPAASGSWGTVVGVAVVDSATHGGGNIIAFGALSASKPIGSGDVFEFLDGELDILFND